MDAILQELVTEAAKRVKLPNDFNPESVQDVVRLLKNNGVLHRAVEDNDKLHIQWAIGPETTIVWSSQAPSYLLKHLIASIPDPAAISEKDRLTALTAGELKELAKEADIKGYTTMKKTTLIDELLALTDEEEPVDEEAEPVEEETDPANEDEMGDENVEEDDEELEPEPKNKGKKG